MQQSPAGHWAGRAAAWHGARRITPARLVALRGLGEWAVALRAWLVALWLGLMSGAGCHRPPACHCLGCRGCGWECCCRARTRPPRLGGYDRPRGVWLWACLPVGRLGPVGWCSMPGLGLARAAAGRRRLALGLVAADRGAAARGHIALGVVIAGGGAEARATLEPCWRCAARVCMLGLFDDRDGARSPPVQLGVPRLGRMADLPDFMHARSRSTWLSC